MKGFYSIGDLSRRTGIKVATIRYYEGRGILPDPGRSAGNQRRYGEVELKRLSFIAHARELGFSIDAIDELLRLSERFDHPHEDARAIAATHLASVRQRLERLRRLEVELERVINVCDGRCAAGPCRVIETIGDHCACVAEH